MLRRQTTRQTKPALLDSAAVRAAMKRRRQFTLILTGTALAPHYCNGDTLTVCPARVPSAGDAVVAQLAEDPSQVVTMLYNGDGDLTDNRGGFVPRGEFLPLGVVIDGYPSRQGV